MHCSPFLDHIFHFVSAVFSLVLWISPSVGQHLGTAVGLHRGLLVGGLASGQIINNYFLKNKYLGC